MFHTDPTQATRSRNFYCPTIHIPSIELMWKIAQITDIAFVNSALIGERNIAQFDRPATIKDTINLITNQYNPRQVDIDRFNSYTNEERVLQGYSLGNQKSNIAFGVQYINNNLHRRQLGKGTTGSDYDLSLTNPIWGRNVNLKTKNVALFA